MEFKYNRERTELLRVMKSKGEKKSIHVIQNGNKLSVSLAAGKFKNGEDSIPVTFKGNISEQGDGCSLKGKFTYGFNLYTLALVAALLIVARFSWSAYQKQVDNMILCGIATAILIMVIVVVNFKAKKAKAMIEEFLKNLNIR